MAVMIRAERDDCVREPTVRGFGTHGRRESRQRGPRCIAAV